MADPLRGALRRPLDPQIAALRAKLGTLVPTSRWDDLLGSAHDSAGMVAGAVKVDLIADLLAAVDRSVTAGTGLAGFRRDFDALVEKHGWRGFTGDGTAKGVAWRTRVIWQTNVSTSYAAGRWAQLKERGFKYLVYRHGGSVEPRLQHLGWDGLILPIDHPFWRTHFPPNGWGCSCKVRGAMSLKLATLVGGNPLKQLPDDWAEIDPRTGSPKGIGRGWDYLPGASIEDQLRAMTSKVVNWDFALAKAFMRDLPDQNADLFSDGFRSLPSLAVDTRRYVERVLGERNGAPITGPVRIEPLKTFGLLSTRHRQDVAQLTGVDAKGFDFTLDASAVRHVVKRHGNAALERARGQRAVTPADFEWLPLLLNDPDAVWHAKPAASHGQGIFHSKVIGGMRIVALFELRTGRNRLSLVTMWIENADRPPSLSP